MVHGPHHARLTAYRARGGDGVREGAEGGEGGDRVRFALLVACDATQTRVVGMSPSVLPAPRVARPGEVHVLYVLLEDLLDVAQPMSCMQRLEEVPTPPYCRL